MIHFDLPKDQSSIIKVIGVGGGGSNAVNHMFAQNIEGVDFIICNTDAQAIAQSKVPNKIQLGPHLTQGLGAGANPSIGKQATEESLEEIKRILEVNTKMAFITAGMGGGTGTGGAPIIASICKELGILTVGIVTTPFAYEGKKRVAQAEDGIMLLKNHVDTLLVISNDKLRHQFGNLKMKEAFNKADDILATAAKCITDVINSTGQINVDFADVCTVMSNGGVAILGSATAQGDNRAHQAVEHALTSPLLNDNDIRGAKWILININSAEGEHEFTMDEVEIIQNYILSQAGDETDVILGLGYDSTLGESISITLIATGFEHKDPFAKKNTISNLQKADEKIVMHLDMQPNSTTQVSATQPTLQFEDQRIDEKITAIQQQDAAKSMAPTIVEETIVKIPSTNTVDKSNEEPIFFEISSTQDQAPVIQFDTDFISEPIIKTAQQQDALSTTITNNASNTSNLSSGGFLAKPTQIYAEAKPENLKSKSQDEPLPQQNKLQADEPVFQMQLVVKENLETAEEKPLSTETAQPYMSKSVEDTAMQDDAEALRRRASERIAKLRNLSFNINATDPNNEFESVPAYLRRNMEIHNQIADVETFYSNYTVKSNDNNQAEINTINNFLDGVKPD
ncbi:MAG: cell division protein FtsZ [Ferruginibacter sp.]|nr:cell division protein FtsZ [Ferruginibacter sp.]